MIGITISKELKNKVPELQLSAISCNVNILEADPELFDIINRSVQQLSSLLKVEDIAKMPAIQAARKAYKSCGKDPARYRLSAEALLRRVVKQVDLYKINNVVDLLNFVSFTSGISIGGYDLDKINGDVIFGIGEKDEIYRGVGRGDLNIEYLPVFRDSIGAFGSATSDSERTMVTESTKRFLMVLIGFGANETLQQTTDLAIDLLQKYAQAASIQTQWV